MVRSAAASVFAVDRLLFLVLAMLGACSRGTGITHVADAGALEVDAGDTGWSVQDAGPPPFSCPPRLPHSDDPLGTAIERDAFGCFGACGPSCKAECLDSFFSTWTDLGASDGGVQCARCDYVVKECKSHAFCRWHDDCYRQCDLRWDAVQAAAPATPPDNPCYRNCDNPVVSAVPLCAVDWTQIGVDGPYVRDACWDGTWVVFSTLAAGPAVEAGACAQDHSSHAVPWDSTTAAWDSTDTPPATLPEGYSCTVDTDCPDRNQDCAPDAGDYDGVNGWGRCENIVPFPDVEVAPLIPEGLQIPDAGLQEGAPCGLDYQCAEGHCAHGSCAP